MQVPRPVTLKALATELGLNVSTVSRVLSDPLGRDGKWASPETTQRIFALAEKRDYRRNPYAASLRTNRSNLIGVIVPRLQDYVLATIYEGIDEAALSQDYLTMVSNSLDVPERQRDKAERLLDHRVDGLIFGDAAQANRGYLDELRDRAVPHTLVSRHIEGHTSVTCDDRLGGRLIAEHLVAQGRRVFGVIAGKPGTSTSADRTSGFIDALAELGIAKDHVTLAPGGFDAPAGREAAEQILAANPATDAIFAVNDFAAIGALGVLHNRGIRVPEDIALAGYNDTALAAGVNLTTVRSPMHKIGSRGFALLIDQLGGARTVSEQLPPELIVRDTA